MALILEDLAEREEQERIRKEAERVASPTGAAPGKKADPKKDAKKPDPKKGAPVADDPNVPKDITIEYAEDVPSAEDYLVLDKNYLNMKTLAQAPKGKPEPGVDKRTLKARELQEKYVVYRALPQKVAVVQRLNYVAPPEPEVPAEVEAQPEPQKTPAKGGARKK